MKRLIDHSLKYKEIDFNVKKEKAGVMSTTREKARHYNMKIYKGSLKDHIIHFLIKSQVYIALAFAYKYTKIENVNSRVVRLYFRNVYMKYYAIDDYAKNLVRIRAKKYGYELKSPIETVLSKIFRTKLKKRLNNYWYIEFIFDRVPKKGFLEVKFI